MTAAEYRALLGRAVRNRVLTADEAASLYRQGVPAAGKLPSTSAVLPLSRDMVNKALAGQWAGVQTTARRNTSIREREAFSNRLQADFDRQARNLAASVSAGRLTVAQWHVRMRDAVTTHQIRQHMIGKGGGIPTAAESAALNTRLQTQQRFLARFAESMAARSAAGRPYSEAQAAHRAAMYGGAGRAEWWRAAAGANGVRYVALDDGTTCGPCLSAEGVYPPGANHPYPGEVCLGRARCRCRLIIAG